MSSQAQQSSRAPGSFEIHHALLRPVILQIMRAQGYHSSTPATVDAFTSLTAKYMMAISGRAAHYANANNEDGVSCVPNITDIRMALEDCGALKPDKEFTEQVFRGEEDTRGVDNFIQWATGPKNLRIRKVAGLDKPTAGDTEMDGQEEPRETDYLSALKRKHNRTGDDSKYASTILGRGMVDPDPQPKPNPVHLWAIQMHEQARRLPEHEVAQEESPRPASSGLSSLADEDVAMMDMDMDMNF
ncbi:uncharacterized protein F4807DRAFT_409375 [Annulohypoxylon truncatum]|uniref:uncharacterized protein n=1 Tax=Annulohypoxylon truncatum TaxID=327061 RepID=UPI0020079801|nr:uncharacterized protein F4807DRAFT_409375 [Annulohypoxylon truncatum]KAI1213855.1 hypothetical protein F4807DRAFT_409375 [Annulohypoxylon truncatum]